MNVRYIVINQCGCKTCQEATTKSMTSPLYSGRNLQVWCKKIQYLVPPNKWKSCLPLNYYENEMNQWYIFWREIESWHKTEGNSEGEPRNSYGTGISVVWMTAVKTAHFEPEVLKRTRPARATEYPGDRVLGPKYWDHMECLPMTWSGVIG